MLGPLVIVFLAAAPLDLPRASAQTPPAASEYFAGFARRDITPKTPIRLAGFASRSAESEGTTANLWAKAMAVRAGDDGPPLVIVSVEACVLPAELVEALRSTLVEQLQIPRARTAVCFTHSHTAPMVADALATLFGQPIPPEHVEHIERYTRELTEALAEVAQAAVQDLRPVRLSWGVGEVGFAINRRTRNGPVDHDLPVLVARDAEGKVRGVLATYACHCVTLSDNKVSGDWAGFAMEAIEREWPEATALMTIGCGADQNPASGVVGDRVDVAREQGASIAQEVSRLLRSPLSPIAGPITASLERFPLPLAPLPTRDEWLRRAAGTDAVAYHARVQSERLERGESLATRVDYSVQTFAFGQSLAMAFLPGEVVVDYSTRLKRELDGRRLWVHGYSNAAPGYVPSERILREGGYEGGGAMTYYDLPIGYAPGLEDKIVAAVRKSLQPAFLSPHDADKLQNSRPLSPQQSLARMRVAPELEVELVAAEPFVADPVAIDFGAQGQLWVAEMHDYPSGLDGQGQAGGRVRLLRDRDGDGQVDASTIFVDGIPFPTGVLAWREGVLICAAPDILYAVDTDGDDRADIVRKAFSGFGVGNFQARVNSLVPGLDGWIYGSCGLFGGTITPFRGEPLELGDRDFRIRPDDGRIEPATGRSQQGRVRDDWGNWFGCDNSNLGRHYPLDDHDLRRNPYLIPPPAGVELAGDPQAARLFPALPQAQRFKLSGATAGVTAACGIGVYRDRQLGDDYRGDLFTCEPVNLLIHRLKLTPEKSTFRGRRADNEMDREFWTTTDNWSRPVQVRTGPDGALWIVDMYRFVIEHPRWIPEDAAAQLDVRAGSTLGRIYRVRPKSPSTPFPPPLKSFEATTPELWVDHLRSPNGTVRDMASLQLQWLFTASELAETSPKHPQAEKERQRVVQRLRELTHDVQASPESQMQAMCTLDAIQSLDNLDIRQGTHDLHPGVRRHGYRLAARGGRSSESFLRIELQSALDEVDPQIRLRVAASIGEWRDDANGITIARMGVWDVDDPHLRATVLSSITPRNARSSIEQTLKHVAQDERNAAFLLPLVSAAIPLMSADEVRIAIDQIQRTESAADAAWKFLAIARAWDAAEKQIASKESISLPTVLKLAAQRAREVAYDAERSTEVRAAALGLFGRLDGAWGEERVLVVELLAPRVPLELQSAAIQTLARRRDDDAAATLLERLPQLTPAVQATAFDMLLSRPAWTALLLTAYEEQRLPLSTLDAARRQRLLQSPHSSIRERATKLFAGVANPMRAAVVESHRDVVDLSGDVERGRKTFQRVCANCHRWGEIGHAVGPDLSTLANKSPAAVLLEILDPNRNVDSRYTLYTAVLEDGRTVQGLLANETGNSLALLGPNGVRTELRRSDIEQLRNSGQSLMPEGLERDLSKQDLADLLTLLAGARTSARAKTFPGNQPQVVSEQRGQLRLAAAQAEIFGDEIQFEAPFQNIGYWHALDDHAAWNIKTPRDGRYDVYLEGACADESAGNAWRLEIDGDVRLKGRIAGTGGWNQFRRTKVGTVDLKAGPQRWIVRPDGPTLRGALVDLRAIWVVPEGQTPDMSLASAASPPAPTPRSFESPAELARFLLDDAQPVSDRTSAAESRPEWAAALVRELAAGLDGGADRRAEEYRRIPWIWRVALVAGKADDRQLWIAVLDASLPSPSTRLRDWQAVVIGGGLINGLSQQGAWPTEELNRILADKPELAARWREALTDAARMADDAQVPTGTRYDALRMIALSGWDRRGPQLLKYLNAEVHPELQLGAVSGLADIASPQVIEPLVASLPWLPEANRRQAIHGLLRTRERREATAKALAQGRLRREWLTDAQYERLSQP
ncbi:MAG: PVC-type heme-binding CxxCH protein [Pirellulales bacterium]